MCDIANLEAQEKNWEWMKCYFAYMKIYEVSPSEVFSLWSTGGKNEWIIFITPAP